MRGKASNLADAQTPEQVGELLGVEGLLGQAAPDLRHKHVDERRWQVQEACVGPQDIADMLQREPLQDGTNINRCAIGDDD